MYYNLNSGKLEVKKDVKALKFLYNTIIGRLILKIICLPFISKIYAKYLNSRFSRHKIKKFVKNNCIDMTQYEKKEYNSFNDFFIRKIKDGKRTIQDGLVAICDAKLSVYKIDNNSTFKIKNSIYSIPELIQESSKNYEYALIFRLCVDDYHHYVFPDNGKVLSSKKIKGILHTVQPIAFKRHKVFIENTRCVTMLECENLGHVCYIEVGALMVGKIVNEEKLKFKKGEEKGHFEFGGSTIVLLIEKNKLEINQKIIDNTNQDIETIVKLGETIGR